MATSQPFCFNFLHLHIVINMMHCFLGSSLLDCDMYLVAVYVCNSIATIRIRLHRFMYSSSVDRRVVPSYRFAVKVAFSRKELWKYILHQFFFNFSSIFFDRACDWLGVEIWIQIQLITSSVKKFRGKLDEKLEKYIFS